MQKERIIEISPSSECYPSAWQTLSDAPQTLYALGNTALLNERKFTVVGSRKTPVSALKIGKEICRDLSNAFTVVTGTADGGDGAAIEGALAGTGNVICLLAGGFGNIPQNNLPLLEQVAKNGLLLSPHAFDTPVRAFSYEYRNKLLAYLGEGTLVLGAAEKSGALITAKYASQAGKPIFALPYAPGSYAGAGCNALLKKGGFLTENSVDIFDRFGINLLEKKREYVLSAEEKKMLEALKELSEAHVSELSAKAGIPVFKARAILSALEVKGLSVALGGNRYAPLL